MRITLPEFSTKKEMFAYLIKNKKDLITQKKMLEIQADTVNYSPTRLKTVNGVVKTDHPEDEDDRDVIRVKVVANTANFIDSHMDMLLPDAAKKSIAERKGIIPHIHDHIHEVDAKLGEVVDITLPILSFSELGIEGSGSTQVIQFITDIMRSDNEKIFLQYKEGRINQHSIGLQYLSLDLAINDEDSEKEFDFWNKHFPQVINKEVAERRGFFWVVQEIRLIENSAVLFGANPITPTLDNNVKEDEPGSTTHEGEPSKDTQSNLKTILLHT